MPALDPDNSAADLAAAIAELYEENDDRNAFTNALRTLVINSLQPDSSLAWSKLINRPSTLAGYGITNGQLKFMPQVLSGATVSVTASIPSATPPMSCHRVRPGGGLSVRLRGP